MLENDCVDESCYYHEYLSHVLSDFVKVLDSGVSIYRSERSICMPTCMARGVDSPFNKKEVAVLGTQFSKIKFCYATQ